MVTEDSKEYLDDFEDAKLSDSFGNNMDQFYNDHKKESQGAPFEIQNSQRPVSKYQRDRIGSAKRDPSPDDEVFDEDNFFERLNNHLNTNQISQNDFCDNVHVLLSRDDLKEIFKKIRFNISSKELDFLICHNNPNQDDDYIYCSTLYKHNKFSFFSKNEISKNSSTNQSELGVSNTKRNENQMKEINAEFNTFKLDILRIVETENRKERSNLNSGKLTKIVPKKPANNQKIQSQQKGEETQNQNTPEEKKIQNEKKVEKKKNPPNYLTQTLNKKRIEEDMNRLAIEKKNKEFQRDCVKKMVKANEYAEILNIPKSYSAYAEEQDNNLACRVYDKDNKEYTDIDLKQFLLEFKKLNKIINQNEERKKYKESVAGSDGSNHDNDFFKMSRKDKHKVISTILKESLELKIQLKKQLKALRDKNLIDVTIINKNLKLTNLDDKKNN